MMDRHMAARLDAWITRDPPADPGEQEYDAFCVWADDNNVPIEVAEDEHPDHAIYDAWLALQIAIQDRDNRLENDYWANYEPKPGEFDYDPEAGW